MDEKNEFISSFREIQPKLSRFYTNILGEIGLSLPQYALLNQLHAGGTMSMTNLSEKLHITKPAVTHLVDRLEKHAFIKRIPHPEDRRIYLLEIQPKGVKITNAIQSKFLKLLLESFDQMNLEERKIVTRFYALLSKSVDLYLAMTEKGKP
ncbi:MAG: hypothetical protein A3G33_04175 [Omnitrophica bacterium RIFCSPLOWO2_12_FULL_44_17]|uniref:HTH marR-type domain-containing protein n=1 Tax=Candidatus Danuiimicrobium aquiferis TaxID=1801832 RepID=A0A1G1KQM9_9BACT|nr:MAG: hypothetical protein A3B72_10380 [Omnitrophica bacterium RIFCSPHIGHO2_02_FULL_45_28]OGW90930.1 MAG: hypothetical protein A3E74_00505 [Omnitrophica bacterium RIFCSPHIGHO2_12_FULL_44_12]OGW95135.1 MAG: hypothetical protein A3G33_04175 [Omnitrophica bacterium RIFCSPLOWO2_12_FULL_44_17]OGX01720.1 MAG: hypothetical protein A3J12_04260 [Omnitrophica bacterium RIFCSPLOWO2_02_FULL_44_11]